MKEAMKAKNTRKTQTIRLVLAALKDRDIASRGGEADGCIDDKAIITLMQSMVKQRRESITMYEKGGRLELAEQEAAEIDVIESFLPKQMGDDEIQAAVAEAVKEIEATSIKDMGKVMAVLRDRNAGCMDFAKAGAAAKSILA